MEDTEFVKEAVGKGLYSGSAQLDQEHDVSFIIHKATVDSKSYLTVQLEKHRRPVTVDEKKKFLILPFNGRGPITDDIGRERISFSSFSEIDEKDGEILF